MAATWRYASAAALLVTVSLLPAARIDAIKASRVAALEIEARQEASRLTPADDSHVERPTQPAPISSGNVLRAFLVMDALLLVAVGWLRRARGARPALPAVPALPALPALPAPPAPPALSTLFSSGEVWVVIGLTVFGAVLRFTGSGRDLWIDEITTLVRHVRSSLPDILLQATSSNNHLLNSLLGHLSVSAFGEKSLGTAAASVALLGLRPSQCSTHWSDAFRRPPRRSWRR